MSNSNDEQGGSPNAASEHYQPWLRNQAGGQQSVPGTVARPEPLPTVPAGGAGPADAEAVFAAQAAQQRQRPATLSADELLAKPIAIPPQSGEGPGLRQQVGDVGTRIAGALGAFTDRTIALGRKADVPSRLARLELGRRARDAGSAAARIIGKGAAGTGEAAKAAMDAASRAGEAAAPKIKAAASAAKDGLAKGASAAGAGIGGAARRVADATALPMAPRTGTGKGEPAVESQLDRLLEQEAAAPRPARPSPALPLFAEPVAEIVPPAVTPPALPVDVAPAPADRPVMAKPSVPPKSIASNAAGTAYAGLGAGSDSANGSTMAGSSGGRGSGQGVGRSDGDGPSAPAAGSLADWARHPATWVLGGIALLGAGFGAGAMWSGPGINREATERTIQDYLLNNPQIIPQAMEKLQSDRQALAVNQLRERIEAPFSGAWAGAADGDVVLTVFTDYACTFCRASVPDIDRLLREDRKLKVVFRELPLLSRDSEAAARLALVAARRGRYMSMHRALFETGTPDSSARIRAAESLEVPADNEQLNDPAITRELENNIAIARELGFNGTPSWVVGNKLLTGAVGYDQLRAAVAEARGD